jgi:hypothetical protein
MDSLEVQARSLADPTKSARTTVHLFGLRGLRPRALSAGVLGPITLAASGANLDLATAILISSSARAATFSGDALRTTLAPNDLAQPGTLAVSAATASGPISNTLPLVVAPLRTIPATVAISAAAPSLTAQDIIVTDDSGLGLASPVKLNLLLLSLLRAGNCDDLARRPLRLQRPALDSATFGVCLAADGIGANFSGLQIFLTGPADVTIANIRTAATGSAAILVVDLVLTASTAGGARSLVLQNPNHDVSAAFGAIVIE